MYKFCIKSLKTSPDNKIFPKKNATASCGVFLDTKITD